MENFKAFCKRIGVKKIYYSGYKALDKVLQSITVVPQTYSFMSFASHGVGTHAYLYYLNLCDGVFALPWHILYGKKYSYGELGENISLRFLLFYLQNKKKIKENKWGLTFDGSLKSAEWIKRNCILNVPVVCLVRDPVAIIASIVNMSMWDNIVTGNGHWADFPRIEKNNLTRLDVLVNFKTSMKPFTQKIKSINYFDTKDFVGDRAYQTMQRIGEIIGVPISKNHFFGQPINNPFKRHFPKVYSVDGIRFRVSPFPDQFSLHVRELTYKTPYESIWEIYHPKAFLSEKLYIANLSGKSISLTTRERFFDMLQKDMDKLELMIREYEKHKITNEEVIMFLNQSKHLSHVKKTFEYEVSDLIQDRRDIVDSWKYFHQFMGM